MKVNKRMKGIVISKPIIYGNTAAEIIAPRDEHTHKWTVLLKGSNGQDISYFIHKVEIKLHETFIDSNRIFKSEPYEVSETGWGEFEVIIKIYFPPFSGEKPISIYHMLKLYPPENLSKNWPKGKAIQNLFYEELIFSDPTEEFYEVLTNGSSTKDVKPEIPLKSTALVPFSIEAEADEAKSLEKAIATMKKKISEYREKMSNVDKQNSILKQEIATLESNLPSKK